MAAKMSASSVLRRVDTRGSAGTLGVLGVAGAVGAVTIRAIPCGQQPLLLGGTTGSGEGDPVVWTDGCGLGVPLGDTPVEPGDSPEIGASGLVEPPLGTITPGL